MRFSVFTSILAAGSFVAGGMAAPASQSSAAIPKPSLSAGQALAIVNQMNTQITDAAKAINQTLSGMSSSSSDADKKAAVDQVGSQFQKMTLAISQGTGSVSQQASGKGFPGQTIDASSAPAASVQDLAKALKTTLITVSTVVNTALAVLGLTPLLIFLTPLTGALSGLVATLQPVVDQLLPVLQVVLDGVVQGLVGLLGGLVL